MPVTGELGLTVVAATDTCQGARSRDRDGVSSHEECLVSLATVAAAAQD